MSSQNPKLVEERADLTPDDKKQLASQNFVFLGGSVLMFIVGSLLGLVLFQTLWIKVLIGVVFLGLIGLFLSTYFNNTADIRAGKKTIKSGRIWDVYEKFEGTARPKNNPSGIRNFYFRVGSLEHRFFQMTIDAKTDTEDSQNDSRTKQFKVGQTVALHYTKSEYLLKEEVVSDVHQTETGSGKRVEAKVESNYRLTQYLPRRWKTTDKGDFYYLVINKILYRVPKAEFEVCAIGASVRDNSNLMEGSTSKLEVQNMQNSWIPVSILD